MKKIFKYISILSCLLIVFSAAGCENSDSVINKYNKYNVTFLDYDGTILKDEIVLYGEDAIAPEDPTRQGYKFIGWDKKFINVRSNVLVTAQYERDYNVKLEFNVTFKDYDGTILKEEKVLEGSDATAPELSEKEGYKFIGWDKEYTNIQDNITVVATFYKTCDTAVVTFNTNGGTKVESVSYSTNNFIDKPNDPEKEGYDFVGWFIDGVEWNFSKNIIKDDITLDALWIEDKYNFRVEDNMRYIDFGRYPQSEVKDVNLIAELEKIDVENEFGYLEYNGIEYKKEEKEVYIYKDDALFPTIELKTFFYIVESITWKVIETKNGELTLLADDILDALCYNTIEYERVIAGNTIYANDYEYSNIRAWLNGYDGTNYEVNNYTATGFIDFAFNEEEQNIILEKLVKNTRLIINDYSYSYEEYNTLDKITLLSLNDVKNIDYGLDKVKKYITDEYYQIMISVYSNRQSAATSYALSKGLQYDNYDNGYGEYLKSDWLLKTPDGTYGIYIIDEYGESIISNSLSAIQGICPVLTITITE